MPAFLSEILSQMNAIWARLDLGQRLTIGAVLLATMAGLGSIVWFAQLPDFQVIKTSADAGELTRVGQALDQAGITYKTSGNSVTVESGDIEDARRALASAGIGSAPQGGLGDLGGMTSDRATRMHALSRAVERDAERKLAQLRGVTHAQVSHSKPKRSPYRVHDAESQPRANVGLRIDPSVSFRGVAKAARAEAAAALGMPPEYITVTNLVTGQTDAGEDEGAAGLDTNEFVTQQRRRSEELTARAQSLLDLVHPGKAIVRVTVQLDPEWIVTKQRGAPDKPVIVRTKTTREDTKDPMAPVVGDPSATAGPAGGVVGTAAGGMLGGGRGSQKKEIKETEYSQDAFKETTTGKLAPDIRRMSVALVIDQDLASEQVQRAEIESAVKNAIGWSSEFGDESAFSVLVTEIPELPVTEESVLTGVGPFFEQHGPVIGQVIAVLLVLGFLSRLLKRSSVSVAAPKPASVAPMETSPEAAAAVSPEESRRRMRREIERAIAEDPAAMSRLLESWLMEQKV